MKRSMNVDLPGLILSVLALHIVQACPEHCKDCASDGRCRHCTQGFYGVNCTVCSPHCLGSRCVGDLCSKGCVQGRFGYSCQDTCPFCPAGCDQWSGSCAVGHRQLQAGNNGVGLSMSIHSKILLGVIIPLIVIALAFLFVVLVKISRKQNHNFKQIPKHKQQKRNVIYRNRRAESVVWKTRSDTRDVTSGNIYTSQFPRHSTSNGGRVSVVVLPPSPELSQRNSAEPLLGLSS